MGLRLDRSALCSNPENLIRADLSPAERALHVDARKTLYEEMLAAYPALSPAKAVEMLEAGGM
jgi:hypothetical protein